MKKQGRSWILLFFLAIGLVTMVQGAERQQLAGHVPAKVRSLAAVGRLDPTNRLQLSIGLPLRNTNELERVLREIYDPASTNFHHYLTPQEFAQRFGPTTKDCAAVVEFCRTNGLAITSAHPNGTVVGVSATAGDVERVLHTRLSLYKHPEQNRFFYAPESEPTIDLATPILHIQGLNSMTPPRALSKKVPVEQAQLKPNAGSGTKGSYLGKDFRLAYAPGVTLNGSNQILGLLEFDGYYASDITAYINKAGLAAVPLKNVLINGYNGAAGDGNGEVSLDIQVAIAMAPGLKQILVYEASTNDTPDAMLYRMATDNTAKQISCSWTWGDHSTATDQIFAQLAAQGQAFFQAAGDWNAWAPGQGIDAPADNPNVTVVGGTTLNTAANGSWSNETVWSTASYGTGGGCSTNYPLPSWQAGINMTGNSGSTTKRNIPDVALTADNVMSISDNGVTYVVTGTSIAAPLWAAFTAMINQQAAANGQSTIGFLNPTLYSLGKSSSYLQAFHDTIIGDNTGSSSPIDYYASGGYDLCTGWGTPTGSNTINALLQIANHQVDHFAWTPPTDTTAGASFNATVNAQALDNSPVSSFNGTATLSAIQIQTNVLFSRDFESGTTSDWNAEGGVYAAAIDSSTGAAGTAQSFTIIGGASNNYDGFSHSFPNLTPDKVEFYVKAKANNVACGYFVAGAGKYRTNAVFHFRMDLTATMGLTDGEGNFYTTNYVANQWYKIDLLIDWTNKVIGYYVNDALVAANVPFCNPSVTSLATANLYNFNRAQVWYDQISFSQAVSTTVALNSAGGARFTNGVWSGALTVSWGGTNVLLTANDGIGHTGMSSPFAVQAPTSVTVTLTANPANGGTVDGGGTFVVGSQQTISANALAGWGFTQWQDGSQQNPRAITVPATDVTYTALFMQLPQITTQPSDVVVTAGGPATFNIDAAGPEPLSYFWQENGVGLAGATNTSYTIPSVQWTDSGSLFSCVVSNAGGAVTSQSVKLTVRPAFGLVSVNTNAFTVVLNGAPGSNYVVQVSTNLTTWTPLITLSGTGGQTTFIDTNLSAPYRFYRISGTP